MRLTIVGCSGSFPGPDSAASCYLVSAEAAGRTWRILLDLGSGAVGAVQKYLDLQDIDAIFLTHLHPDHCMDLCGLHVAERWNPAGANPQRIPVYGPRDTGEHLAQAYGLPAEPGMREEFDFRGYTEGEPVQLGPFTVTPTSVNHPMPEAYALRVTGPGESGGTHSLTYSGDTDSCQGLTDAAQGAELFLCEAAFQEGRDDAVRNVHLTGQRAGETAALAAVHRLVLTHLPVWTEPEVVLAEARGAFAGPVDVAMPGAVYEL